MAKKRILLIGGGHAHVEVLRRFALSPDPSIDLALVSPDALTPYSGMLPGLVAGHYTSADIHIELAPLCAWANARFLRDSVVALAVDARAATLASGVTEAFDLASIDIGSTPDRSAAGVALHATGVKPVGTLLQQWQRWQEEAARGALRSIAVVGGGAGGVETLLAMQYRLLNLFRDRTPGFHLVTDQDLLLPRHPRRVRDRMAEVLAERGVAVHFAFAAAQVTGDAVVAADGRRLPADRVVWATSARPAPWLAASGLACDARGFVELDDCLQSTSHSGIFAAGDCAAQRDHPRPKSGVYAVRQGPPLTVNLQRAAKGLPLLPYRPQRQALALISTGDRFAIASRGPLTISGRWVWRWKDRIDRAFMARYRRPSSPAA